MNFLQIIALGERRRNATSIIVILLLVCAVGYVIWPTEEAVLIETLSVNAVVVPLAKESEPSKKTSSFQQTKIRLPDGTHAFVVFQASTPKPGDTVKVIVKVFEDGRRKVIPPLVL